MSQNLKLIHSYWTKPAITEKRWGKEKYIEQDLYLQALSCLYIKTLFPQVSIELHTDSLGAELCKNFPYDKIHTTLDKIPDNLPTKFYSAGKIYALQAMDLNDIHIDNDVFITKQECIDKFYKEYDVLTQSLDNLFGRYIENNKILLEHDLFKEVCNMPYSLCCGVLCIKNQEVKDEFIKNYLNFIEYIIKTPELLEQFTNNDTVPDLTIELLNLYYVSKKHKVNLKILMKLERLWDNLNKELGYAHYAYTAKYKPEVLEWVKLEIKRLDINLYNKLNKQFKSLWKK